MNNQQKKSDPIRPRYYRPLELAETFCDWVFWIIAILSVSALAVARKDHTLLYDTLQGTFILGVLILFFISLTVRLYWQPRAEDKRRQDLLSNSFAVSLTHEQTTGYYNNQQTEPMKRLCASLLESSFFSKNIALKMAHRERIKIMLYAILWIAALLNRGTDLALGAAMAQAVFSEQIISRWIRLEWIRMRFEGAYDGLYRLVKTTIDFDTNEFRICVLEAFGEYQTGKAYGGLTLSPRVYEQLKPPLSTEWQQIRQSLKI